MKVLPAVLALWLSLLAAAASQLSGWLAAEDPDRAGARFTNQWVVHVDGSVSDARAVAKQHGFEYMRQVPGVKDHHLMRRPEKIVHFHAGHHKRLRRSSKVVWAQQEEVKVRKKRSVRFNDKMYPQQWYLRKGAQGGYDMNVRAAWDMGYTGKGVVVTILDDGLDYSHPDLKKNYDPRASYDVNDHDRDPMPRSTFDNENKHGTRCAGEVAASANNNLCNVGVAFKSKIGGVRMLDGDITDSVEGSSLGLNQNYIDIYSGSWGPDDNGKVVDGPGVMARNAFERGVRSGRRGLGNIFIWASGNGGSSHDSCACDGYAGSIYTLSVSSVSERNKKPWYLEECASTLASTYSSGYSGDRQVITTDLHHACTDKHTGTSASAPMAAGIIALVLEANRNLTWRDVQYLTVITADPLPFRDASWITNGVGRKVSLLYGYGLMDAGRMAYLAPLWRRVPEQRVCDTGSVQFFKPIYGKTTITASFHTNGCSSAPGQRPGSVVYVEQVLLYLNLTFTRRGELRIALVSPSGTRSVLLPPRSLDTASGNTKFNRWPLASAQFWGERAAGEWRLEVENTGATHNAGRLSSGRLMLYGVDTQPVRLRSPRKMPPTWFQKEFAKLVVPGGRLDEASMRSANGQLLCHPECLNTTACAGPGPTQCYGPCRSLKVATTGACVAACPLGTFPAGSTCQACHLRCESCRGAGPHNCTTCPRGSNLVDAQKRCLEVGEACPWGTYKAGAVCWACPTKCAACEVADRCLSCRQDNGTLVLAPNGTCLRNCPAKYFVSPDKRCLPCQAACAACISARLDGCISCPPERLLLKTNRSAAVGHCVTGCPAGFYHAPHPNSRECLRCHFTCSSCFGPDAASCSSCRPGLMHIAGSCLDPVTIECKIGHYLRAGRCLPCHKSCSRCGGSGEGNCLACAEEKAVLFAGRCLPTCPAGLFAAASAAGLRSCRPCAPFCAGCSSASHCTRCRPGALLQSPGAACRPNCPPAHFLAGHVCEKCPESCAECEDRRSCLRCANGTVLTPAGCRNSCPDGHGAEGGRCGSCPIANCSRCSGPGLTKCLECRSPLSLDANGKCSEEPLCPLGEFRHEEKCLKCHSACRSCSGPSSSACLSCPLNSCLSGPLCRPCCSSSSPASPSAASCANCSLTPDQPCLDPPNGPLGAAEAPSGPFQLSPLTRLLIVGFIVVAVLLALCYLVFFGLRKSSRPGILASLWGGSCRERGHRYDPLPQHAAGSPNRSHLDVNAEKEKMKDAAAAAADSVGWTVSIDNETVTVRWPNGYALPVSAADKNSDVSSGVGSSPDKSTDEAGDEVASNGV